MIVPTGVRNMNGYGSHTYSLISATNERFWVKFHFKTLQGHKHWTNAEAAQASARRWAASEKFWYQSGPAKRKLNIEGHEHGSCSHQGQDLCIGVLRGESIEPGVRVNPSPTAIWLSEICR